MRYLSFCFLLFLSCESETTYDTELSSYETINFITLTNETTGGGSQKAYLQAGLTESEAIFCYCQQSCSRTFIVVAALEFNSGTTKFRYKENLNSEFVEESYQDWCTRTSFLSSNLVLKQ